MYYKFYCNIFIGMSIIICNDLQDANKERQKVLFWYIDFNWQFGIVLLAITSQLSYHNVIWIILKPEPIFG
jgi:hypothetical protein